MTFVRFQPTAANMMHNTMHRLMNEMQKVDNVPAVRCYNPRLDITEDDKNLYFNVELPGMAKEDVKISVKNDERLLVLKGEKKRPELGEEKKALRSERIYGCFERSFELPDNVNFDSISAKYENGVLELTLPKIEPPQPKEVEININ